MRLRRAPEGRASLVCDSEKVDRFARDVDALVELAEGMMSPMSVTSAPPRMGRRRGRPFLTMPLSSSSALPMTLKRRFQLVRDIGGKLAAALLGQLAIGDIEGQEGRAAPFRPPCRCG